MKTVLSTKTLDGETLAFARTLNLEVECVDFIETSAVPFGLENIDTKNFDAIVFTSANAVAYFFEKKEAAHLLKGKQIFALQGKTDSALLARGVKANIENDSAEALADKIISAGVCKSILHVCGNLRLSILKNKLEKAGVAYTDLIVYQTKVLSDKKVNKLFDAILFFSPSGVEGFMVLNDFNDETVCCCIGETTAQALKQKKTTANIIVPNKPTPTAMLTAVADYFNNNEFEL